MTPPALRLPSIGARRALTHTVERYPHFRAPAGAVGTVVEAEPNLIALRMDDLLEGAEDWNNEIHWYEAHEISAFWDDTHPAPDDQQSIPHGTGECSCFLGIYTDAEIYHDQSHRWIDPCAACAPNLTPAEASIRLQRFGYQTGTAIHPHTQKSEPCVLADPPAHDDLCDRGILRSGRALRHCPICRRYADDREAAEALLARNIPVRRTHDGDHASYVIDSGLSVDPFPTTHTSIDEATQATSFQNATLQRAGRAVAFSIETHVDVPAEVVEGGIVAISEHLRATLAAARTAAPALSFKLYIGPSDES